MSEKEIEKTKELFEIVEVPTGSALAFKTPEGEIVTTEQLLVTIANEVREIRKAVA